MEKLARSAEIRVGWFCAFKDTLHKRMFEFLQEMTFKSHVSNYIGDRIFLTPNMRGAIAFLPYKFEMQHASSAFIECL